MSQHQIHELLGALPKCEQHLHLEGTLEPHLLFTLAKRNNIQLPSSKDDPSFESEHSLLERYGRFTSLDDFLHYYFIGMSVLVTAQDFEDLAYAYFERAHSEGVVHAECFFDPQAHTDRGITYQTVLSGFEAACQRARTNLHISCNLIVCILRHLPVSSAQDLYDTVLPDLQSHRLLGLGLSSTEKGYPPHLFKSIYTDAHNRGINLTAHAGEEADVSYMRSALEDCHVRRADHGIKLPNDPDLMSTFAQQKILVTMCPLSNLKLRCISDIADLPIQIYLNHGVAFSINSDDPAYFGGYILANYHAVQDAFNLSIEQWTTIATHSIQGSWCEESRKEEMWMMLRDVLNKFT